MTVDGTSSGVTQVFRHLGEQRRKPGMNPDAPTELPSRMGVALGETILNSASI